jgi:hypothetical protein
MKVRRDMFPRKDTNHNPQESRQLRHQKTIPWCTEVFNSINQAAILIMTAAIGIQIGIGTEIDENARNSTPIAIAISISTVRMCHN